MKFNSLLAIVAAAYSAQIVNAIDWGTMCTEPNFGGTCTIYQSDVANKCVNFSGKDIFWNDKISSLIVNPKAACTFFTELQCSGQAVRFLRGRYGVVNPDKQFSSFRCVKSPL